MQWEPSCCRGPMDRQAGMTKLIVTFRDCSNTPKDVKAGVTSRGMTFTLRFVKILHIFQMSR